MPGIGGTIEKVKAGNFLRLIFQLKPERKMIKGVLLDSKSVTLYSRYSRYSKDSEAG